MNQSSAFIFAPLAPFGALPTPCFLLIQVHVCFSPLQLPSLLVGHPAFPLVVLVPVAFACLVGRSIELLCPRAGCLVLAASVGSLVGSAAFASLQSDFPPLAAVFLWCLSRLKVCVDGAPFVPGLLTG